VQKVVDETNTKFASVETIKAFALLPKELDHDDGELTATQKVRRSAVTTQFEDLIDRMYAGDRSRT
jgi:long-chain acyl-CoA synthetase